MYNNPQKLDKKLLGVILCFPTAVVILQKGYFRNRESSWGEKKS